MKFENYLTEASKDLKKEQYNSGVYKMQSAFTEFSRNYMEALGQMVINKKAVDPKYKKFRDQIATAYERMSDAISKHMNELNKPETIKRG